jgi:raffinose/stachyose/melibiose transport system permease protein
MSYSNPRALNSVRYLLLACFALVILYPFVLMLFGSLKSETAFLANPVSPPTTLDLGNYQFAWNEAHIPKFALNSLIVAAGTVLLTLVSGSMAAFALSRIRFRGRAWIYLAFVTLLTIPVQIYIIPLYVLIVRAHLSDSLLGLILPYTAGSLPLAIFLLKTYFDQLPSELMDAARLSRPVLSTVTIFTFVQSWNEFFLALVFIHNPDLQTLPLGLQAFFVNQYETQFPQLFATLALSIAPVVIVYLFLQKQFIAGLTAGAVKA